MESNVGMEFNIGKSYTREQIEGAGLVFVGFEEKTEEGVKENIESYTDGPMAYVFKSNNGQFELLEKRDAHHKYI